MENIVNAAPELLLLTFMVITFLQSGIDKIIDWKGNLGWLKGHFEKSPLRNSVPLLLATILLFEVIAGILCLIGLLQIAISGVREIASCGAVTACIVLLMLLFGQRMAKDYDGARTIVIYFIPAVFLVFLLSSAP